MKYFVTLNGKDTAVFKSEWDAKNHILSMKRVMKTNGISEKRHNYSIRTEDDGQKDICSLSDKRIREIKRHERLEAEIEKSREQLKAKRARAMEKAAKRKRA